MRYKLISATLCKSGLFSPQCLSTRVCSQVSQIDTFHKQYREYSRALAKLILYPYYWCWQEQSDRLTFFSFGTDTSKSLLNFLLQQFPFFFCFFSFFYFFGPPVSFSTRDCLKPIFSFLKWMCQIFLCYKTGKSRKQKTVKAQHWRNCSRKG